MSISPSSCRSWHAKPKSENSSVLLLSSPGWEGQANSSQIKHMPDGDVPHTRAETRRHGHLWGVAGNGMCFAYIACWKYFGTETDSKVNINWQGDTALSSDSALEVSRIYV